MLFHDTRTEGPVATHSIGTATYHVSPGAIVDLPDHLAYVVKGRGMPWAPGPGEDRALRAETVATPVPPRVTLRSLPVPERRVFGAPPDDSSLDLPEVTDPDGLEEPDATEATAVVDAAVSHLEAQGVSVPDGSRRPRRR